MFLMIGKGGGETRAGALKFLGFTRISLRLFHKQMSGDLGRT
jgi:hypothetical protein